MIKSTALQSGRSRFKYWFCTTVLKNVLQSLTEYLFYYPSFFSLHHNRWTIMEYYGSVWHLSFCCALNVLWKEMKYGYINVPSVFTQCLLVATIFVCPVSTTTRHCSSSVAGVKPYATRDTGNISRTPFTSCCVHSWFSGKTRVHTQGGHRVS